MECEINLFKRELEGLEALYLFVSLTSFLEVFILTWITVLSVHNWLFYPFYNGHHPALSGSKGDHC